MRTVLIERAAMECELHSMLGHPTGAPLSFEPAVEHGDGNPLNRTLALLAPEFGPTGLATYPALAVRLSRLVIAGVLTSYRHNYSDELEAPAYRQHPRAIRLAVEFIESHPEVITTVADIARTVGLSVRALNAGFQRSVGTTPTRYLRSVRLARVHEELRRGDPSTITATAAARRWGFAHYGRFAADYRAVYGTAPASTLRSTGGTHGSNLWSLKRSSRRA
jgi:AraC-like DNA-binding protein